MYETMNTPEGKVQVSMLKHILTTGLVHLEEEKVLFIQYLHLYCLSVAMDKQMTELYRKSQCLKSKAGVEHIMRNNNKYY
jgi:hypothetical protein